MRTPVRQYAGTSIPSSLSVPLGRMSLVARLFKSNFTRSVMLLYVRKTKVGVEEPSNEDEYDVVRRHKIKN